jgi:hypothetical protein
MAKVTFASSNTLLQTINKLNDLSLDVGDLAALTTSVDSDIVGAINRLKTRVDSVGDHLDSNVLDAISVLQPGGDGSLRYSNTTGILTFTGPDSATGTAPIAVSSGAISITDATTSAKGAASFSSLHFDVSSGAVTIKTGGINDSAKLADDVVSSRHFKSGISLIVYDSSGSAVKTIHSPGV